MAHCVIIVEFICFMEVIYNDVPETNHASWLYSVAAVLYLQFALHVMPRQTIKISPSTSALPSVCMQCPVWLFFLVPRFRAFWYVAQVLSE